MRCNQEDRKALETLVEATQEVAILTARLQTLPEREKLDQLKEKQVQARNEQVKHRAQNKDQRHDVLRLRREVAKLKERERADRKSLGVVTDKERRRDIRHDLESTHRRLQDFEERLERAVRTATMFDENLPGDTEAVSTEIGEAQRAVERAENALQADMDAARSRIKNAETQLDPRLLEEFERGMEERGVGAAWLKGRMCQGCYMELDPLSMREIRNAPADALVTCPECNVILLVHHDQR